MILGKSLKLSGCLCPHLLYGIRTSPGHHWTGSKQGSPRHTVGLQTCWGAMVSLSWLRVRTCRPPQAWGLIRMMNPIQRETTGLCVTRQQEGESAVNGSPAGSGDKCSEQVPDMGVTGMLLPPRAPGALDWSTCTHEGLGWEEMGQPGTRTADCPGSVDDSHQGTFKSVQPVPSQTLTCIQRNHLRGAGEGERESC